MASLTAVLRLLLRPFALWCLFICGSLSFVFWIVAFLVRGGMYGMGEATTEQIHLNIRLQLALGTVLFPAALGSALAWPLFEFLMCPFALHLPALRKRLYGALLFVGLAGAALTAWWCEEQPGAQNGILFVALAFPCFSWGFLWADPVFASLGATKWVSLKWPLQALVLTPIFIAPEWVALGHAAPLPVGIVALVAGAVMLWLPFRKGAMRLRLLAGESVAALLPTGPENSEWQTVPDKACARTRWAPGRTLSGIADWRRAALYEAFGHVRGGWIGAVVGFALVWCVVLGVIGLIEGFGEMRSSEDAVRSLYGMLAGKVEGVRGKALPMALVAMPIWGAMFLVSNPFTLFGGGAYPLGRAQRAELAWRTSLLITVGYLLSLALILALMSEVVFRLSGLAERAHQVPDFLHALGGMAIGAPLAHAVRLRWMESSHRPPTSAAHSSLVGLVGLLLGIPAIGLSLLFSRVVPRWNPVAWVLLVALLVVCSQGIWRKHLVRHFSNRDLIV